MRFQRLPHIFDHTRLQFDTGTLPEVDRGCKTMAYHQNPRWRPGKTGSGIIFERQVMARAIPTASPHYRPCRLHYVT